MRAWICALLCLAMTSSAWAQADPKANLERAQALITAASAQFGQKNFAKALAALLEAEEIANAANDPSLAPIRFNIARCYEELERPKDALKAYERYNELPDQSHRKQRAQQAIAELNSKIYGTLGVSCQPVGALVAIEGLLANAAPCPWTGKEVDPGEYTIKVSYAGFQTETKKVTVRAGHPTGATFSLKPINGGPSVVVSSGAQPDTPTNFWPWVTMGTGLAIAAGSSVFTFSAISSRDEAENLPPSAAREDAFSAYERDETISWVGYGIGGAAFVGGLIWLLTDEEGDDTASLWRVTPNGVQVQW